MKVIVTCLIALLGLSIFLAKAVNAGDSAIERKIVIFKDSIDENKWDDVLTRHQAAVNKRLRIINASSVKVSKNKIAELASDPDVLRVDPDIKVHTQYTREYWCSRYPWLSFCRTTPTPTPTPTATPTPTPTQTLTPTPTPISSTQQIPWGITKINAQQSWALTYGNGVKVGIIDTGINLSHPDLGGNIAGCVNFINPAQSCEDDNGHGTHVAGIISAINNTQGVIGASPSTRIYALKSLDSAGSGYLSDIIEGIDWSVSNSMQIVNMSLGTSSNVLALQEAVQRANQAGVTIVAAAGNSGQAVIYPAAYPEVIAVSATDQSDNITSWSSRGSEVDLAAPGASIYSTYTGSSYKTMSGTSMATPHVAGAAALLMSMPTKCDRDGNNRCSPSEVKSRLESTARDLGSAGQDNLYGAGLVDSYRAISAP